MAVALEATPAPIPPEEKWPAVAMAYDLGVKPSYDLMLKRLEIMEGRIRALITVAISVTFGIPIFANAARGTGHLSYTSNVLYAALSCALFIALLGMLSFMGRHVSVPDPALLHATATNKKRLSPWEFQRTALRQAGESFKKNRQRLAWKGLAADVIAGVLLLEMVLMLVWAVSP